MTINFNEIVLYSTNKELLEKQLLNLFEYDFLSTNENIVGPKFSIIEDISMCTDTNKHLLFDYRLSTLDELKQLLQKVEFFIYRNIDELDDEKPPRLLMDQYCRYFILRDIDGRKWRFSSPLQ